MLQLALMSSENRAANALGRHHPGGLKAFVAAMNEKARHLGMQDTHFVEPTGLSSSNVSTARDLSRLVREALEYPLVRQFSTASGLTVDTGYRMVSYRNTNRLISSPDWDIGLQKTGYISEAGSCLVMQASIEGRPVVMVLLDAAGSSSRFGDAQRLRHWLEHGRGKGPPMRTVAAPSFGS
jgi:D-alanyl-D-alanine endopeptidase (penicillin-binding protein 7)